MAALAWVPRTRRARSANGRVFVCTARVSAASNDGFRRGRRIRARPRGVAIKSHLAFGHPLHVHVNRTAVRREQHRGAKRVGDHDIRRRQGRPGPQPPTQILPVRPPGGSRPIKSWTMERVHAGHVFVLRQTIAKARPVGDRMAARGQLHAKLMPHLLPGASAQGRNGQKPTLKNRDFHRSVTASATIACKALTAAVTVNRRS